MQKVSPHWCLNDKPNWQEGTEREGDADAAECLSARAVHGHAFNHTRTDRKHTWAHLASHATKTPSHLTNYNVWELARFFFSFSWHCRYLSHFCQGFTLKFAQRQRNPKWTHMSSSSSSSSSSLARSPLRPRSPLPVSAGYCTTKQEYGAEVNITCCIIPRLTL